jgi:hypothetical protein
MKTNCIFHKHCFSFLCPMQSREENIKQSWLPYFPICKLKKDVPFWVEQQRRIADKIKLKHRLTVFDLLMLEAPLKITADIKGVTPVGGKCQINDRIEWFIENRLPIPEELDQYNHYVDDEGDDKIEVEQVKGDAEEGQTIH